MILTRPKLFEPDQNDLDPTKTIWAFQNYFGPIEGQGINVYLMQWLDFFQVEDAHQNANRTYHGHVYKGWQSKYWNHSLSFRPNDAKGRAIRAPNWDSFSNPDQKMCNRRDHTRPPTVFRTSTLHQFWSKNECTYLVTKTDNIMLNNVVVPAFKIKRFYSSTDFFKA